MLRQIYSYHLKNLSCWGMTVCRLSFHHGNTGNRKNLEQKVMFQLGTLFVALCTGLTNTSHSANLLTNSCHHISTDGKAPWHSLTNRQHPSTRQWFLDEIKLHFEKALFSHSWVTYIWLLNLACPKTAKKIYAASSNATSSSRVCKSEGDFSQCKNLFGNANCALLLAAEEIYGSSLQRSELF